MLLKGSFSLMVAEGESECKGTSGPIAGFFDHFYENSRRKKLSKSKNSRPFWG